MSRFSRSASDASSRSSRATSPGSTAVAEWLDKAGDANRAQALEALQIAVLATQTEATVTGVLPYDAPPDRTDNPREGYCHENNHADARCPAVNRLESRFG